MPLLLRLHGEYRYLCITLFDGASEVLECLSCHVTSRNAKTESLDKIRVIEWVFH